MTATNIEYHYNDVIISQLGVSNHQPHDCLLDRLSRRRSKKKSKLRVTGLFARNSPGPGEFPALMASNAESVSIRWRHHDKSDSELTRDSVLLEAFYMLTGTGVPETHYTSVFRWIKSFIYSQNVDNYNCMLTTCQNDTLIASFRTKKRAGSSSICNYIYYIYRLIK